MTDALPDSALRPRQKPARNCGDVSSESLECPDSSSDECSVENESGPVDHEPIDHEVKMSAANDASAQMMTSDVSDWTDRNRAYLAGGGFALVLFGSGSSLVFCSQLQASSSAYCWCAGVGAAQVLIAGWARLRSFWALVFLSFTAVSWLAAEMATFRLPGANELTAWSMLYPATLVLRIRRRLLLQSGLLVSLAAPLLIQKQVVDFETIAPWLVFSGLSVLLGVRLTDHVIQLEAAQCAARRHADALAVTHAAFDDAWLSFRGHVQVKEERIADLSLAMESRAEHERRRLARELHDNVGQLMVAATMELGRLQNDLADGRGDITRGMSRLRSVLEQLPLATREVLENLRPRVLEQRGLVPAVTWLVQRFEMVSGCPCALKVPAGAPEVDLRQAVQVFRMLQELLTNVVKHSCATRVDVELRVNDVILLRVEDDGVGFDVKRRTTAGFGLESIQQRAADAGGAVVFDSVPGRGTRTTVELPLRASQRRDLNLPHAS